MISDTTIANFRAAFRRSVACWKSLFDEGRTGTEYAFITPEEVEVFGIRMERYPAMVALFEAYEAVKNICDMGSYDVDLCATMRQELDLEDDSQIKVEEMQALGQVVGVSYRDASAMFYKVLFWERRTGLTRFKDEIGEGEEPIPF